MTRSSANSDYEWAFTESLTRDGLLRLDLHHIGIDDYGDSRTIERK
jgi:hypothetical protein